MSEWYGTIPERWEVRRLGALLQQRKEKNDPVQTDFILSLSAAHGIVPYTKRETSGNKSKSELNTYAIARQSDLIVNCMNVIIGSSGVTKWDGAISPVYYALFPRSDIANIQYYEYIFRSPEFYRSLRRFAKGILEIRLRIAMENLNNVSIPLPPRTEQDQIVRYLDWKVSQVNRLINAKKKQIGLLQEQKRAVTNTAVTKGGKGWQKRRLKTICGITYGLGEPPKLTSEGIPIIRATNVERGKIVIPDMLYTIPENITSGKDVILSEGNIIVVRSGAYAGDVGYITNEWVGSAAGYDMLLRVKIGEPRFLMYALLSEYVLKDQWYLQRIRSAQPHLNAEDIGSSEILFPPIDEQRLIALTLDKRCGNIERTIEKIQTEITLLHEYRTRLISDVVTGKLDVRGMAVPKYKAVVEAAAEDEDDLTDTEEE